MIASLRIALIVALPTVAAGCFDVPTNQRAPLLIDDFDSGKLLPVDPHFDQWRCGRFQPDSAQDCTCGYDDKTYHSYPYSMHLYAKIQDAPDGVSDDGGAHVYTQAVVPEDLSHMSQIAFSAMLDLPPSSSGAAFYVELYCSLAHTTGVPKAGLVHVLHSVDFTNTEGWQSFVIALSKDEFSVPTNYKGAEIEGGLTACLESIDSIHFSVNTQLGDGLATEFDLHLDDVYFQ